MNMEFTTEIDGVECTVTVKHYMRVPPDPACLYSDWDYTGYVEFEYTATDPDGIELRQISDEDDSRILEEFETLLEEEMNGA